MITTLYPLSAPFAGARERDRLILLVLPRLILLARRGGEERLILISLRAREREGERDRMGASRDGLRGLRGESEVSFGVGERPLSDMFERVCERLKYVAGGRR